MKTETPGDQLLTIDDYAITLEAYLRLHGEEPLYRASLLSQQFIESGLGPEDIIALHFEAFEKLMGTFAPREQARVVGDAHQFLLEIMINYGVRYKEYLELKLAETLREADARALRERERAMEFERVDRERSQILASIAHELRTPITAAIGHLDLATRSLETGQVDRLPPMLSSARQAMDRLSRLSADLVEASRGEPQELDFSPQDLDQIIQQALTWARPAAATKGVLLDREGQGDSLSLNGNADAMLSILGNLLSNSIRYTPSRGRVTVRQRAEDDWVTIEVEDTGIGMTPEVQERIFEKFYRAPEARNIEARGLGLGLSLVRQLVDAHRGRVEVESVSGQGTTIRVKLPRHPSQTKENAVE